VKVSWQVDDSYEFVAPRGVPRAGDEKLEMTTRTRVELAGGGARTVSGF